ncbi:MAG: hypothetical protein K6B41_14295 [Butyrivibrio sp.]|nr:hypothetical protein [Butyrivibrio sp.]
MDKYEYKIRADEIKSLISEMKYAEAVKIADTIDWKRVRNVAMLGKISDLYKINRRYEESRDILLLAYERYPQGRAIVSSLCEISIKMGEFVQAVEYYKEFLKLAPKDSARYILQYKLYVAQDVSLEERIAVLEEFKRHDYVEKWAYELAYLYHRVGLATECVEECDEMFIMFGDGRYVMKALELKALHESLSPEQKAKYELYKAELSGKVIDPADLEKNEAPKMMPQETVITSEKLTEKQPTKELPHVGTVVEDVSQDDDTAIYEPVRSHNNLAEALAIEKAAEENGILPQEEAPDGKKAEEDEIFVPTVDVGNFNTINLQKELAENLKAVIGEDYGAFQDTSSESTDNTTDNIDLSGYENITGNTKVFENTSENANVGTETFENTLENANVGTETFENTLENANEEVFENTLENVGAEVYDNIVENSTQETLTDTAENVAEETPEYTAQNAYLEGERPFYKQTEFISEPLQEEAPGAVIKPNINYKNNHFDKMLSQDYDGQISMALDEQKQVESQITGQISIADIMQNWEAYKKQQQEETLARIRKRVSDETGNMFGDFYEKSEPVVQQKIEDGIASAIERENTVINSNNEQEVNLSNNFSGTVIKPNQSGGFFENFQNKKGYEQPVSDVQNADLEASDDMTLEMSEEFPLEDAYEEAIKVSLSNPEAVENEETAVENEEIVPENEETAVENEETALENEETALENEEIAPENEETALENEEDAESEEVQDHESMDAQYEGAYEGEQPEESVYSEELPAAEDSVEESYMSSEDEEAHEDEEPDSYSKLESLVSEELATDEETSEEENHSEPEDVRKEVSETAEEDKIEDSEDDNSSENKTISERLRVMTPEEKELFGPYIHHRKSRRQIIRAIDNMSMDAFSGNVIVTGEPGAGTVNLAKGLIKAVQASDSNFSGKVAKTTASTLNKKSVSGILDKLANGALIIQRAADLKEETVVTLIKELQNENKGIIIVMEDTKDDMNVFLDRNPELKKNFNVRVDIEALDDDSLVAYAKQYALEKEYAIDDLGILALHTVIANNQRLDHDVTISEVKGIVDDAIYYANKHTIGHYFDTLLGKRFDREDMIILREKDFMH